MAVTNLNFLEVNPGADFDLVPDEAGVRLPTCELYRPLPEGPTPFAVGVSRLCRLLDLAGVTIWVAVAHGHAISPVWAVVCLVEEACVLGPVRGPQRYLVTQIKWASDDLHDEVGEHAVLDVRECAETVSDVLGELSSGGKILSVRDVLLVYGVIQPCDILMLLVSGLSADMAGRLSEGARRRLR